MDYFSIGQRIRKLRKAHGFSQEELAEKVNISTTHMSHIETGNTKLSLPVLVKIADCLHVQTDALLSSESSMSATQYTEEIAAIMRNCSVQESKVLLDLLKAAKISMDKHL